MVPRNSKCGGFGQSGQKSDTVIIYDNIDVNTQMDDKRDRRRLI